jgi:hypothetical protein
MSFVTAAEHCITELEYVSADDVLNIVHFRSLSASRKNGEWNHTSLDIIGGATLCTCKGFETGRECWHVTLVLAAWQAHPARVSASRYTGEQLVRAGHKAANMLRVTRTRTWRVLPSDQVQLLACRDEYLRRTRAEREARAGETVAA